MSQEEIDEFDRTTVELRKKSKAAYWESNKHREELKRPGRSTIRYMDKHNLWENSDYYETLKGKKNVKFVETNLKGKEVLPKEVLPNEVLSEEVLDKGKGKAKVVEVIDSLSGSEYLAESSQDSTSQDDFYQAIEESREQARNNSFNKKGESSKRSK